MPLNATDAERQQQANADLAKKMQLETQMVSRLRVLFNQISKDLEAFYSRTGQVPDTSIYSNELSGILFSQYRRTGDAFSGRTVSFLREADEDDPTVMILAAFAAANSMTLTELLDSMQNDVRVQGQNFITTNVAQDNANILSTTQKDLDSSIIFGTLLLLNRGIMNPTRAQVAKAAKSEFKRVTRSRPNTISTTVTQKAAEGTKQIDNNVFFANRNRASPIPLERIELWITRGDEVVRPAHVAADNQRKNQNGVFVVGGEQLRFPGDISLGATPGNVINCRCAAVLVVDDTDTPMIENVA